MIAQANATFCLEPGGDSPYRKSLSDSIALGCIPVLFHSYTDAVAPWMWADWKRHARVLVPRDRYLGNDPAMELPRLLGSIPRDRVEAMQATLVARRQRFLYSTGSLDDAPGDAAHIILTAVHAMAVLHAESARAGASDPASRHQILSNPSLRRGPVMNRNNSARR